MRTTPCAEVAQLQDGETIMALTGRIVSIWEAKSGTTKDGKPYCIQNFVMQDATGKVDVKCMDREPLPLSMKGAEVRLESVNSGKGFTGLKAFDDTYQNKTTRKVKMTPSAIINAVGATEPEEPDYDAEPPAPAAPARQQTRPGAPTAHTPPPANGEGQLKVELNKLANLYLHCMAAGDYIREQRAVIGFDTPDEQYQAAVSSLYISTSRDGLQRNVATGAFKK